jgi:hypothetical protein
MTSRTRFLPGVVSGRGDPLSLRAGDRLWRRKPAALGRKSNLPTQKKREATGDQREATGDILVLDSKSPLPRHLGPNKATTGSQMQIERLDAYGRADYSSARC